MAKIESSISPELETRLEALRREKKLAPISSEQEGTPLGALPDQIVGYTHSPVNASTPLYTKRGYQAFEVHRLTGGVIHVLGFITEEQAAAFFESKTQIEFNLYPEPRGEAKRLVEVPLERVVRARPLSRSEGNYMPLRVDPA